MPDPDELVRQPPVEARSVHAGLLAAAQKGVQVAKINGDMYVVAGLQMIASMTESDLLALRHEIRKNVGLGFDGDISSASKVLARWAAVEADQIDREIHWEFPKTALAEIYKIVPLDQQAELNEGIRVATDLSLRYPAT